MTPLEILERTCRAVTLPQCAPRTPPRAGVYLLTYYDDVVYVGSSSDIDTRLYSHLLTGAIAFHRALWVPLPVAVHPHYEGAFIRALRPRYNLRAPRGIGYDAEILDGFGLAQCTPIAIRPAIARDRGPLARRIRDARRAAGLTVAALAALLGVCRQAVGHWESGRNAPGLEYVPRLAAAIGLSASDLLPEVTQ